MGYGLTAGVLYNLGAYPGVRLGGTHFVYGEVYQISPELERQLDAIEEVWPQPTGEYSRREVQVALTGREAASWAALEPTCLIYEIAEGRTAGMPVIVTGNWLDASL